VSARFVHALALLRILAVEEAAEALGELLPEAERTGSAWWSTNTRAYLAVACVLCHDTAGAEKVIEARASLLGSAAERRLEWAKAELALLRRNGSAAGAIVDGLLRAPPGDAHAPIPQLLFVRGAALALERRFTSASRTLERAREAAVDSGGLALLVRIEDALAKLHARQNHRHRAKEASARANTARDELLRRAAEVHRDAECRRALDRILAPPGRVALRKLEAERFSGLTRREREISTLIGRGSTNGEVARSLGVSRRTVETHVENILFKLGVRSRVEIALWASKNLG
jgi:DNA-binding CsgD family transcriptional regulator/cytochrome c553